MENREYEAGTDLSQGMALTADASSQKTVLTEKTMKKEEKPEKTRRVGTFTAGLSMVVFGVMFLLCSVFHIMEYELIFAMWPVILISLGGEILVANFFTGTLKYDKGSVFIMIFMMFAAAGLALVDVGFETVDLLIDKF